MSPRQPDRLQGKRVGKYKLDKRIGQGGMGDVYQGHEVRSRKRVAVKVLAPQLARDVDAITRFRREVEAMQRLDHPHIARVLDVGEARGHTYMVMELLRGSAFRRLIAAGDRPDDITSALAQVADALAYAHEQGVIHRDVKPENVLLHRTGHAKVADFGLARMADATSFTTDGAILGTVKYISPEQARGERAGPESDVYSMGVMMYEAITGQLPFESVTQHGFIYQHVEQTPKKPRMRRGICPDLAPLTMACLAKDPSRRPSMRAVADALGRARQWRPRTRVPWALAVLATLVAGVAWLVAYPRTLDPIAHGWLGAPGVRAVRDAALAVHDAVWPF